MRKLMLTIMVLITTMLPYSVLADETRTEQLPDRAKATSDWMKLSYGERVALATKLVYCPEPVIIVQSTSWNAWITDEPPLRIFITTTLIDSCQNVDELGGVLAHERGHKILNHFMKMRISQERLNVTLWGAAISAASRGTYDQKTFSKVGDTAMSVNRVIFGHKAEFESDKFSYCVLLQSHGNPMALSDLFSRTAKEKGDSKFLSLLSTHPSFDERINRFVEYEKDRKTFLRIEQGFVRLVAAPWIARLSAVDETEYKSVCLGEGKVSYWLFWPTSSEATWRKGNLAVPKDHDLDYIVLLSRRTVDDSSLLIGFRAGDIHFGQPGLGGDFEDMAVWISLSQLPTNDFKLIHYWLERNKKNEFIQPNKTVIFKIIWPKGRSVNPETAKVVLPPTEMIAGSLVIGCPLDGYPWISP